MRGRIIFDQNQRIIELFQSRNLSTPLHELGHMWLEELRFDASLPEPQCRTGQGRCFSASGRELVEITRFREEPGLGGGIVAKNHRAEL